MSEAATRIRAPAIVPGPGRYRDSLRSLRSISADPLAFFGSLFQAHGDVVQVRFPGLLVHGLRHPDMVRHVLQEKPQLYRKGPDYELMKPVLGEGLLTSEGAFWKRQRRLAQPAFHRQQIAGFAELMASQASAVADRWIASPGEIDLHTDMMALTLAIVGQALFGTVLSADSDQIARAVDGILEVFVRRARSLWILVPLWIPTPWTVKFRRYKRDLDAVINRTIAERRAQGNQGRHDLLSMLMEARDEDATEDGVNGAQMSDQQLRDECMTMMLAGHETTANLLSWTLLALSRNPALASRLRDQVDAVLRGALPKLEDLPKLGDVERTLKESLRLYPPAWTVSRRLVVDDEIAGIPLPKGSQVLVPQYFVHRKPDLWPDPERFDPDRFTEAEEKKRPRFSYFPFGGGPRQCIGNGFAMLEAQLILIVLLQRTRIDIDPERPVPMDPSVTLRPKHGLRARVGKRE